MWMVVKMLILVVMHLYHNIEVAVQMMVVQMVVLIIIANCDAGCGTNSTGGWADDDINDNKIVLTTPALVKNLCEQPCLGSGCCSLHLFAPVQCYHCSHRQQLSFPAQKINSTKPTI